MEKQGSSHQQSAQPEVSAANDQIISEEDFFNQYQHDNKIAADAKIDEETGQITVNPVAQTEKPALTDSEALVNTEVLISMRESAQAFGLSYYVEGNVKGWEKYQYEASQKQNLIRAWSRIIQKAGIRVSPWLDVLQAEIFATGPLIALAYTARKTRLEHEIDKAKLKAAEQKLKQYEQRESFTEPQRRDTMKQWEIDEEGYFTHSVTNQYLKKNPVKKVNERHERPKLTKENYEMLIKHNGKAKVDKAFNL